MNTLNATPATLSAVLLSARGGEEIRLAPGDYGDVTLRRRVFAEPVRIVSPEPRAARLRSIAVRECEGVSFEGLAVAYTPDMTTVPDTAVVYLQKSKRIRVIGGEVTSGPAVNGVPENAEALDGTGNVIGWPTCHGVTVTGCENVLIQGAEIHHLFRGMNVGGQGTTVTGNEIHHTRKSAIVGGGSDLLINANHLHSAKPWRYGDTARGGDHGDWIAIWNGGPTPLTNIKILNNRMETGDGSPMMGGWAQGKAGGIIGYEFSGNSIIGGDHQGLIVSDVTDGKIHGNVMLQDQPTGAIIKDIGIIIQASCRNIAARGNLVGSIADAAKGATGAVLEGNIIVQRTSAEKPGYLGAALTDAVAKLGAPSAIYAGVKRALAGEGEPDLPPPPALPARDVLREIIAKRTVAKLEPLKTKGRIIVDFKTPAEGQAALAAVLAIS